MHGDDNGPVFGGTPSSARRRAPGDADVTPSGAATRSGTSATASSRTRTSGRGSGRTTRRSRTRTGSTRAIKSACAQRRGRQRRRFRRPRRRAARPRRSPPPGSAQHDLPPRHGLHRRRPRPQLGRDRRRARRQDVPDDFDEVYLRIGPDHDVKLGQELTVFRPVRKRRGRQARRRSRAPCASISGTRRSASRARRSSKSLDVIERGARIGPVGRRFEVVPPVRNDADVARPRCSRACTPHAFYGRTRSSSSTRAKRTGSSPAIASSSSVAATRGTRASRVAERHASRIALESDSPADIDRVPRRDDAKYPEEVVGELRVLAVREGSATCLLTRANREIETGDTVVARKGY